MTQHPEALREHLAAKELEFESVCARCGGCCGAFDGDMCSHLRPDGTGRYYCDTYATRLGMQLTVSGKPFHCVPIREVLRIPGAGYRDCAYLKGARF